MKVHTVLLLAGGDGDRFYPLEQKIRFRFNGKTVLQHIVSSVSELAEHIVVVVNTTNESSIKSDLSAYSIEYVNQAKDEGGMADAVLAAKQLLTKDVLILNGNDLFDFSILTENVEKTQTGKGLIGLVAKHMEHYFPGGYVRFEGEQAVEIVEKPSPENRPSDYVKLVADYITDASLFIHELERLESSDDQFERALSVLIKKKPAVCFKYNGDWTTLKFSWHVLSMQEYFFKHDLQKSIDSSSLIHKTATIEGEVFIGKNVKIGAYTKITGPCYIGDNVLVGDHSLVRNSTLDENVLVGSGCEVARSYLAQGVMLHRNYVGDSVLSENVTNGRGSGNRELSI